MTETHTTDQVSKPEAVESVADIGTGITNTQKDEKETKDDYTEDQFQKSRNSRTAAMFQKHGKLLDDMPSSQSKVKATEQEKSKRTCCFPFCCKRGDKSKK